MVLDTNAFVFGLRKDTRYPACEISLFNRRHDLKVYVPLQVFVESQRNLTTSEMRGVSRAPIRAQTVTWDYAPAPVERVGWWEQQGAKKGDAVIVAHLEAVNVRYSVSENRHFIAELQALPFAVLSNEEALQRLD